MPVKFNNYSMWTETKYEDDWYEWCLFVDEDSSIVDSIKSIEYTLHPSFPNPVRLIEEKSTRFALFSSGWGGFSIKIRINYEDGSSGRSSYSLRLERDDWPRRHPPRTFGSNEIKLVYEGLMHDKYRWRKIATVIKNSKLSIDTVLGTLNNLQEQELVRKAPFLSIDGKEMWGVTAVVGVSPKRH